MFKFIFFEIRKFRKTKLSIIVSIIALAIGMATFIVGYLYLYSQWFFDRGFADFKNIYRIELRDSTAQPLALVPQSLTDFFKQENPEILSATRFYEMPIVQPMMRSNYGHVYLKHLYFSDSSFFSLFNFPTSRANPAVCFPAPNSVALSKTTSRALFGDRNPLGEPVYIGEEGPFVVSAIFDENSISSHLSLDAVRLIKPAVNPDDRADTYSYIKLNPNADRSATERKLTALYKRKGISNQATGAPAIADGRTSVKLIPLKDIYLHYSSASNPFKKGNLSGLVLVLCLVIFIFIISVVNFTNLFLAEVAGRVKEIAIRKCLGSSLIAIAAQLYLSVFIRCFLALVLAFLSVLYVLPKMGAVIGEHLSLFGNGTFGLWVLLLVLLSIIVFSAGSYPIFRIRGNAIGNALSGISKGNNIVPVRNIFVLIQFTITCFFISGVLIIKMQFQFLREKDLGLNPNQVVIVYPGKIETLFQYPSVKARLERIPGVLNVSATSAAGHLNEQTTMDLTINGMKFAPQYVCVDTGYLSILDARFIAGRNFLKALDTGDVGSLIVNESLARFAGIEKLNKIENVQMFGKPAQIIGVVADMNFYGFESRIPPMVFTTKKLTLTPYMLIKLSMTNNSQTIKALENEWKSIEPGYPLRFEFLDQPFQEVFSSYAKLELIIRYVVVFAIALAFIGLFSLISLVTIQKLKEMAIRRVLGASILDVMGILNWRFLKFILLANLISWPLTFIAASRWLDNFSFRISITAAPFLIPFVFTILLTIITVSIRSAATILSNNYRALKEE